MPEQFISIRAYLKAGDEKSIYTQEVMEEIRYTWEVLAATQGGVSITRLYSRVTQLTNDAGDTKLCIETKERLYLAVCTARLAFPSTHLDT